MSPLSVAVWTSGREPAEPGGPWHLCSSARWWRWLWSPSWSRLGERAARAAISAVQGGALRIVVVSALPILGFLVWFLWGRSTRVDALAPAGAVDPAGRW